MNNFKYMLGLCLTMALWSCGETELNQEQEAEQLNLMLESIREMASSHSCEDAANWAFTGYGSKACGGSIGYLAYPLTIDTVAFLEKIEAHKAAEEAYNKRWGIVSDCSLPTRPNGIRCEDGFPVFEY